MLRQLLDQLNLLSITESACFASFAWLRMLFVWLRCDDQQVCGLTCLRGRSLVSSFHRRTPRLCFWHPERALSTEKRQAMNTERSQREHCFFLSQKIWNEISSFCNYKQWMYTPLAPPRQAPRWVWRRASAGRWGWSWWLGRWDGSWRLLLPQRTLYFL